MAKWKYAYPVIQENVSADIMGWPALPDYETVFGKLKGMGYDGIELQARDFRTVDKVRLKKALEKYGLKLAAVGTSPMQKLDGLFLLHEDPAVRAEAEKQAFLQLALCAEFGAAACIGKFRGSVSEKPGCTWEDLGAVLHRIGAEAARLGVTVALEAQNPTNMNHLNTIAEMLEWLRKLAEPQIHLHADTFHMSVTEDDVPASLRTAGALNHGSSAGALDHSSAGALDHGSSAGALNHSSAGTLDHGGETAFFHISDTKRLVLGKGELDFDRIFAALEEISYDGFLSPEIKQNPDSETAAGECAEFLKKYR